MHQTSFCKTDPSSEGKSAEIGPKSGNGIRRSRRHVEKMWKPNEANLNTRRQKANCGNVLDRRSLYSIKKENIAASDLQFRTYPPTQDGESSITNSENFAEKKYIARIQLANATREKFPRQILKTFFCVSPSSKSCSYGMPRRDSRDNSAYNKLLANKRWEATMVNVHDYPDLQMPVLCETSNEFCEILGSSTCSDCIENTNRNIGTQIQSMMFPSIEMSPEKMILPQLARVLGQGHKLQVKVRAKPTPGEDIWRQYRSRKVQETCHKCNKMLEPGRPVVELVEPDGNKSTVTNKQAHKSLMDYTSKNKVAQAWA